MTKHFSVLLKWERKTVTGYQEKVKIVFNKYLVFKGLPYLLHPRQITIITGQVLDGFATYRLQLGTSGSEI